jgi:threonine dehydratase
VFVSAFDDDQVIAGNGGELGEEIVRQCPQVARVLCPVGGGG